MVWGYGSRVRDLAQRLAESVTAAARSSVVSEAVRVWVQEQGLRLVQELLRRRIFVKVARAQVRVRTRRGWTWVETRLCVNVPWPGTYVILRLEDLPRLLELARELCGGGEGACPRSE